MLWNTAHLPFIMSFVLGAAALAKVVLAHDGPDMDEHTLAHHYEERSIARVDDGIRWFYCAGIGIAFACMGASTSSILNPRQPLSKKPPFRPLSNRPFKTTYQ